MVYLRVTPVFETEPVRLSASAPVKDQSQLACRDVIEL